MGHAHWWLDDADATIDSRERAYRLYRHRDDRLGAARVAGALAWDSMLFGGRTAVARGWLDRAFRLLEEEPLSAEHAWLAVREAEVALASGAPADARAAARAVDLDRRGARLEEIQVVGRSLEGLALVHQGLVHEGMRQLDESAVAAKAGDLRDLMWVGKVCCNLISACERVGDVERATQWCEEVKEFAQRWELRALFNVCRTQYAAVLLQTGAWTEAETELQAALAVFSGGRRAALADGTARLGELRRRQGRLEEARRLFAQSERSWTARLGSVNLALDEGDAPGALALVERLERATEASELDRIQVLALLVRAAVAAGRIEAAFEASAELSRLAEHVGATPARAAAAHAEGSAHSPPEARARAPATRGRRRAVRALARHPTSGRARGSSWPASSSSWARRAGGRRRHERRRRRSASSTPARIWPRRRDCWRARAGARRSRRGRRSPLTRRGARGAGPGRGRAEQPGDRGRARGQPAHRAQARRQHPAQARRADSRRSRRARDARRARLSPGCPIGPSLPNRRRWPDLPKSWLPAPTRLGARSRQKERAMPLIQVKVMENVSFRPSRSASWSERLTDAMVEVEGESMRSITWVTIEDVSSGAWGIGGSALTTTDVKALQAGIAA